MRRVDHYPLTSASGCKLSSYINFFLWDQKNTGLQDGENATTPSEAHGEQADLFHKLHNIALLLHDNARGAQTTEYC